MPTHPQARGKQTLHLNRRCCVWSLLHSHTTTCKKKKSNWAQLPWTVMWPWCGEVIKSRGQCGIDWDDFCFLIAVDWLDCLLLLLITGLLSWHYRRQQHRIFKTFDFCFSLSSNSSLGPLFFLVFVLSSTTVYGTFHFIIIAEIVALVLVISF